MLPRNGSLLLFLALALACAKSNPAYVDRDAGAEGEGEAEAEAEAEGEAEAEAEAEAEGEAEAEAEAEAEGETECPGGEQSCPAGQLCQLEAMSGTFGCVGAGTCGSDQLCDTLCCPLGTECVSGECPLPDITVDAAALEPYVETQDFGADSCALEEECIDASGTRKLLRFNTFTPNIGVGDLYLGPPSARPDLFVFSTCHGHYHLEGYAEYALLDAEGAEMAPGRKMAFCLIDLVNVSSSEPPRFECSDDGSLEQGIQAGWADEYSAELPCQWIDVTGVAPGSYTLRVLLNPDYQLAESRYDNNAAEVPVDVPGCPNGCGGLSLECCHVGNPCGWSNDGYCDCNGTLSWDSIDCANCACNGT